MSLREVTTLPPPSLAPRSIPPPSPAYQGDAPLGAVGAATGASVTQISKASELMSKLGELSQTSPTKFTAVTNAIANKLAAQAMLERQELGNPSTYDVLNDAADRSTG